MTLLIHISLLLPEQIMPQVLTFASDAAAGSTVDTAADRIYRADNVRILGSSEDDSPPLVPSPKEGMKTLLLSSA